MKTNWPSALTFKFTCDNKTVYNLLVHFVVLSKLKNDFSIAPLCTNVNGEIKLTAENIQMTIDGYISDFPMGYDGSLSDCTGIEIAVETLYELNARLHRLTEFYPSESKKLQELVKNCENGAYVGKHIVYHQPLKSEMIEIELETKC